MNGLLPGGALEVQRARDEPLADAALAEQQDRRGLAAGHALHQPHDLLHRRALGRDHVLQAVALAAPPRAAGRPPRAAGPASRARADGLDHLLDLEGLGDVVVGALLHGLDGAPDAGVGGDHDHRHARQGLAQPAQHLDPRTGRAGGSRAGPCPGSRGRRARAPRGRRRPRRPGSRPPPGPCAGPSGSCARRRRPGFGKSCGPWPSMVRGAFPESGEYLAPARSRRRAGMPSGEREAHAMPPRGRCRRRPAPGRGSCVVGVGRSVGSAPRQPDPARPHAMARSPARARASARRRRSGRPRPPVRGTCRSRPRSCRRCGGPSPRSPAPRPPTRSCSRSGAAGASARRRACARSRTISAACWSRASTASTSWGCDELSLERAHAGRRPGRVPRGRHGARLRRAAWRCPSRAAAEGTRLRPDGRLPDRADGGRHRAGRGLAARSTAARSAPLRLPLRDPPRPTSAEPRARTTRALGQRALLPGRDGQVPGATPTSRSTTWSRTPPTPSS